MPDFDKLHEHVTKLSDLLNSKEEGDGLSTWALMVAEQWQAIAESWDDQKPSKQAITALEILQRLMRKGYILRMQQVNGDFFVYANHFGMADYPELSAKEKTLVDCANQMEIQNIQGGKDAGIG
jgi:hypothetical protein